MNSSNFGPAQSIFQNPQIFFEKVRSQKFSKPIVLENVLKTYELERMLHEDRLMVLKAINKGELKLYEHQVLTALRVLRDFGGRAILADEVGLGKTIEAGILMREYIARGLVKSILVLTPATLTGQWKKEMEDKFGLDFVIGNIDEDERFQGFDRHLQLICSLDTAKLEQNAEIICRREWDMLVVDEAHRLKNHNTINFEFVNDEITKKYFLLLTATPIQNSLRELYNLIHLVKPQLLGVWPEFKEKYVDANNDRIIKSENRMGLRSILTNVISRTTRQEVSQLLGSKRIIKSHRIRASAEERALYNAVTSFVRNQFDAIRNSRSNKYNKLSLIVLQRQITSSTQEIMDALRSRIENPEGYKISKYQELLSYALDVREDSKLRRLVEIINSPSTNGGIEDVNNSKFLVFTEFLGTQDYLYNKLKDRGFTVVKYNGQMSGFEKDEAVRKFQESVQIMISTSAGSHGKNFQFCNNVVNYDLPWNPMQIEQRIGRVHRIGQSRDVFVHNITLEKTIEDVILQQLYEKINLFQAAIGHLDLIFEEDFIISEEKIFDMYMSARDDDDAENRFSVLGDKLRSKDTLVNDIEQFDSDVFKNFDLSPIMATERMPSEDQFYQLIKESTIAYYESLGATIQEFDGLYTITIPRASSYSGRYISGPVTHAKRQIAFSPDVAERNPSCDVMLPGTSEMSEVLDFWKTQFPIINREVAPMSTLSGNTPVMQTVSCASSTFCFHYAMMIKAGGKSRIEVDKVAIDVQSSTEEFSIDDKLKNAFEKSKDIIQARMSERISAFLRKVNEEKDREIDFFREHYESHRRYIRNYLDDKRVRIDELKEKEDAAYYTDTHRNYRKRRQTLQEELRNDKRKYATHLERLDSAERSSVEEVRRNYTPHLEFNLIGLEIISQIAAPSSLSSASDLGKHAETAPENKAVLSSIAHSTPDSFEQSNTILPLSSPATSEALSSTSPEVTEIVEGEDEPLPFIDAHGTKKIVEQQEDPIQILKIRLAKGEISADEYLKLRELIDS